MHELERLYPIRREDLSPSQYLYSLLEQERRQGLLSDAELENIQMHSIELLAIRVRRYSGADSSSVRVEIAQSIMESIYYTIGLYVKSFPDPELALQAVKETAMPELYDRGRKLIDRQIKGAKLLLNEVHKNRFHTDHLAYRETLEGGIASFFYDYDIEFAAQDTPASIDYPLCGDRMDLVGVEYIYHYLTLLLWENRFCGKFDPEWVRLLLLGYDRHYQDLLINIFSILLTNALGCMLNGSDPLELNIREGDRAQLQRMLEPLPRDKLIEVMVQAAEALCAQLDIDGGAKGHVLAAMGDLSVRLKDALERGKLEDVFITFGQDKKAPALRFKDGKRMTDDDFREFTEDVRACRFASDKLVLMRRVIHSVSDMVDLLQGDCLYGEEYDVLFQDMEDMELALLVKLRPSYLEDAGLNTADNAYEWELRLNLLLDGMDPVRREGILALAEDTQMPE